LQRYLDHYPVSARSASLSYRLRRFIGRHATAFSVGAAACILALVVLSRSLMAVPETKSPVILETWTVRSEKSIAVLPFLDMSEKQDQAYFSDGLSEELIDRLARNSALKVIARTSSFAFKGKNEDARDIAKKLGVAHLLEGSVRKNGRAVHIAVHLIRAEDGSQVWSQTYDRTMADIFKVQDDIADTVSSALRVALQTGQRPDAEHGPTEEAHSRQHMSEAIALYEKAMALEPNYLAALDAEADAYFIMGDNGWGPFVKNFEKSRSLAKKALRLKDDDPDANVLLGKIARDFDWDWEAAQAYFEKSRRGNAENLLLEESAAQVALLRQGPAAAQSMASWNRYIALKRRRLERDPVSTPLNLSLINALTDAGYLGEAAALCAQVWTIIQDRSGGHYSCALTELMQGKAQASLDRILQEPDETWRLALLPAAYWALGRKAESDQAMRAFETRFADAAAFQIAEMHAYRGEPDSAFAWLNKAVAQRDPGLLDLTVSLFLRPLAADPRFSATLARVHPHR
jgi:TolB-like protein